MYSIEIMLDGKIYIDGVHRGNIVMQNDVGPGNDLDKVVRFVNDMGPDHTHHIVRILHEIRNDPKIPAKIKLKAANYLIDHFED